MHFKILSFPNWILDTRICTTTSPTQTGNGHSTKPTARNDESLFLYCSGFPFKAKQSMYKVWLSGALTYREIQTPSTIQEGWLNAPWA